MGFLLAKIVLLLALAAAGGALSAFWWFRRHYEDITQEYSRSRNEWASWRQDFEERLAARPEVNLEPLGSQIAAVAAAVRGIDIPPPAPPADLSMIEKRLMAIEHALFPVQTRIDELESAVRAMRIPPAQNVDLSEVHERLDALQGLVENPPPATVGVRQGSRNLLTHPGHGKPDDLTQLAGVPKVLERALHRVGVFYFWQIAEWSPEDVKYVDGKLAAIHGPSEAQIAGDRWVTQASELASTPTAAHRPVEH
jgi:predicted flap endonuclease-1-like 5' DNA nuclease